MTQPADHPHRADRRTRTLGALAIFVPLFAAFLFWAVARGGSVLAWGWTLPAAALAAIGPAVVLAELLANITRLHTVFLFHWSRVVHAGLLGFVTPVAVINGFPTLAGTTALVGIFGGLGVGMTFGQSVAGMLALLVVVPIAALIWYPVVCLLASGIHDHRRRFGVFLLLWWSVYGALALTGIWLAPMWVFG